MGDFAVFAFPHLFQWMMLQDIDSPMAAHFRNLAAGLMVAPHIPCNLFRPMPLKWVIVGFLNHPPGFHDDNEGLAAFRCPVIAEPQVIEQVRECLCCHFQLACCGLQERHARFFRIRVNADDVLILHFSNFKNLDSFMGMCRRMASTATAKG